MKTNFKTRDDGKFDTGRPTKMTQEVISKLEYAFSLGCTDTEACYYADITPKTLYTYQENNKHFLERKRVLKQRPIFKARVALLKAISDEDLTTVRWFLERKCRDEFAVKQVFSGSLKEKTELPDISQIMKLRDLLENGTDE